MPAQKKLPGEKLDFQITFTLQQDMGRSFQAQCENEGVTIQRQLRYLVRQYMEFVLEQKIKEAI